MRWVVVDRCSNPIGSDGCESVPVVLEYWWLETRLDPVIYHETLRDRTPCYGVRVPHKTGLDPVKSRCSTPRPIPKVGRYQRNRATDMPVRSK